MNREQAEHLLDAYVDMENCGGGDKARAALREVILDAMASVTITSYPYISWANNKPISIPTNNPNNVTCGTWAVSE